MRIALLIALVIATCSCTNLEPVDVEAYYDVDSLVNAQYDALKGSGLQIMKYTEVSGVTDTSVLVPDSAQWEYELGVFKKAGINKPALRGEYLVNKEDTPSGYTVTYTPNDDGERAVRMLRLVFSGGKLTELKARVMEENPVYGSTRLLEMYFEGDGENSRLTEYVVEGSQKMILKDTVTLHITSRILYD